MDKKERWIMVSDGTPQQFYVGKTPFNDDMVSNIAKHHEVLPLTETRVMRTMLVPNMEGGVTQSNMLTPISICRSGVDFKVKPLAWLWPEEDEATMAALRKQLDKVEGAEVKHRMSEAGLVQATDQPGVVDLDGMRRRR
jgi:hypothetical protein